MNRKAVLLILMLQTALCSLSAESVIVFAAASTSDMIKEAGTTFTAETGIEIRLNPASSGTLARQLEHGAYADLYISASQNWMDYVNELSLLQFQSPLMGNELVVISPASSKIEPFVAASGKELPEFTGRLSIADPAHAPAGKYAVEALKTCGWYTAIADRILPGADVRKALSVVEFGETELRIVYRTDAQKSSRVKIVSIFPDDSHSPILYYAGLTRDSNEAGKAFYEYLLNSPEVSACIENCGFTR